MDPAVGLAELIASQPDGLPAKAQAAGLLQQDQDQQWFLTVPVSRFCAGMIAFVLTVTGLVDSISKRTVARWLQAERIKPWLFESWITPKDIGVFLERATAVLDLYERVKKGLFDSDEGFWSADEKTSIQARERASYKPPDDGAPARVESSYVRRGALQLFAGLNIVTGQVLGKLYENKTFEQFSDFFKALLRHSLDLGQRRLHLVLDNGSCHRPGSWPTWLPEILAQERHFSEMTVKVYWLPPRSSWLNQIEIFFSLLQTQALAPNNFESCAALKERILDYIALRNLRPTPFDWSYTARDLRQKHALDLSSEPRLWLPCQGSQIW